MRDFSYDYIITKSQGQYWDRGCPDPKANDAIETLGLLRTFLIWYLHLFGICIYLVFVFIP